MIEIGRIIVPSAGRELGVTQVIDANPTLNGSVAGTIRNPPVAAPATGGRTSVSNAPRPARSWLFRFWQRCAIERRSLSSPLACPALAARRP